MLRTHNTVTLKLWKSKLIGQKQKMTLQTCERTQDSSHNSSVLHYMVRRIPTVVFTIIRTQNESQTSLIHPISTTFLFWQFWALHCHKNWNIRETQQQNNISNTKCLICVTKGSLASHSFRVSLMWIHFFSSCPNRLLQLYIQQVLLLSEKRAFLCTLMNSSTAQMTFSFDMTCLNNITSLSI